jgi:hypothetical protein
MKKTWILGAVSLLALSGLGTACSMKKDAMADHSSMVTTAETQTTEGQSNTVAQTQTKGKPALDAKIVLDGRSATITYAVSNLQLSPDHLGKANVPGEGHLHLTVDGKQKAMLKTTAPVKLENLNPGKHTIQLDLQNNDHSTLGVEKNFEIEVK